MRTTATGHLTFTRFVTEDRKVQFTINADGTGEHLVRAPSDSEQPHFSPDGKRIAVTAAGYVGLVLNADGKGVTKLARVAPPLNLACVFWSPDASRLACEGFSDSAPARAGIYTVRSSDGGDLRRLTQVRDVPCAFSPDGRRLLFVRFSEDDEADSDLMVMNVDGSGKAALIRRGVGLGCDWAPDGKHYLVEAADHLLLLDLHGAARQIPVKLAEVSGGRFSPDGSHVVFSGSNDYGHRAIYTARIDGSELVRVTHTSENDDFADWGP